MIFKKTQLPDVFEIDLKIVSDERGYFARIFSDTELKAQGIDFSIVQANRSFNEKKGTVRGMHFQREPHWEDKIMTCISGSFHVIVVDLRKDSPTHKAWLSFELSAENKKMLRIPKGCANGFQALANHSEMIYFMSEAYAPESASGINYQDPQFNFNWPLEATVISERDRALPFYES